VTHSPYARAPDLSVTLSRTAGQYLTLFFYQHTQAKDVITSKLFVYMSVELANKESRRYVWGQSIIRFSNITKDGKVLSPMSSSFCWKKY
jgi:hypothetical protein